MHEYVFDVKFFSVITLMASDQRTAEAHLENLVGKATIAFGADTEWSGSSLIESSLSMDDEEFPFLTLIDGRELWKIDNDESEIDEEDEAPEA